MLTISLKGSSANSLTFNHQADPNKVIEALKRAPVPNILADTAIPPEKMKLCVQHEVLVGKISPSESHFPGTVGTATCVFLILYNEGNYIAFHVDNDYTPLHLNEHLATFTSHKNIKAILIGGMASAKDRSLINVKHIVEALLAVSERMSIEITAQCLIDDNLSDETAKRVLIWDLIILKASILCKDLYGKSFDASKYTDIKLSTFSQKSPNPLFTQTMAACVLDTSEFNWKYRAPINLERRDFFLNHTKTIEDYEKCIPFLFTSDGFHEMYSYYGDATVQSGPKLRNFVIDVTTGDVHIISELTHTPNRALRHLYRQTLEMEIHSNQYQVAFINNEYSVPMLSEKTLASIAKLMPSIKNGELTDEMNPLINSMIPVFTLNKSAFCDTIFEYHMNLQQQHSAKTESMITVSYHTKLNKDKSKDADANRLTMKCD